MQLLLIDRKTRDTIVSRDPQSADIIKPFLEGKDLKRWHSQPRDLWLIAIPKFWTRQQLGKTKDQVITDEEAWLWFSGNYPALSEWLLPFEVKGKKRGDKGEFWWELRACAYYSEFDKPKIFYPDLSQGAKFHLDTTKAFSVNTVYFYPVDSFHLLGLLNSKVIWFHLRGVCEALRGGEWRLRLFSKNMDTIPIPSQNGLSDISREIQKTSFKRLVCEHGFSRRLADLCPQEQTFKLNKKLQNWWLQDFAELQKEIRKAFKGIIPVAERNDWQDYFETEKARREQLDNAVGVLQQQLDDEVYKLFDLSKKEIQLIEAQVNG